MEYIIYMLQAFLLISLVMFPDFWWGDLFDTKLSPSSIHTWWFNTGLPDVIFKIIRNAVYIGVLWVILSALAKLITG